jgi:hypothetical protein
MRMLCCLFITIVIAGCNPDDHRLSQDTEYFHESTSDFVAGGSLYRDVVADSLNAAATSVEIRNRENYFNP